MTDIPDWMYPRNWIDDPEKIEVEINAEYEGRTDRQASYGNLEKTLTHVAAVSRPDFFDEWDRVFPVVHDYSPPKDANEVRSVNFDAAEAFDYCYRYVTRHGLIYLTHAVTAWEGNRGDFSRRPWSARWDGRDSYYNPVELFANVMAEAPMPPNPFLSPENGDDYASVDDLYEDLVNCDELALRDHDGNWYVTKRKAYIDPKREQDDDVPLLPDR